MNRQLTELLTGYGPIRAIWFDGWWDHDEDKTPLTGTSTNSMSLFTGFNPPAWWPTTIIRIHSRARTYRFSNATCREKTRQDIHFRTSAGCRWKHATQMNGMWGYKIMDQNYKDADTLIRYLVKAAGLGANLLLNIGPQPSGALPAAALDRLAKIGTWMRENGETIYGTEGSPFAAQSWGTSTKRGTDCFYMC